MFRLLEIDQLICDLEDNEEQLEVRLGKDIRRREININYLLIVLSLLTVFSIFTDAASFFDRISFLSGIPATVISIAIPVGAVILFILTIIRSRRKK